jgi:Pin2-interacting protein X1
MGLAGTRTKQRFGIDPRNTTWSNNTERFGHKHLVKLGWNPGSGLGLTNSALTSHIKITLKHDNLGLGANLAKKKEKQDEFDSGENVHLDAFQRLLGRLNGKEEQISKEVDRKRNERILNGRWGINFVQGDTLSSTWDAQKKQLKSTVIEPVKKSKKRSHDSNDDDDDDDVKSKTKRSKKEKKEKKEKKSKDKKEKKEKKSKDKKEKKEKKDKKEKKEKKEKKDKKHKKEKKSKSKSSEEVTRESMLKPKSETTSTTAGVIGSKMALRSKWIKQKRAAVMDEKALQEIFMIK